MGRPRKSDYRHLPTHLRPKICRRKSGKEVIYWLYRTTGKTEICLGTDRNQAFIKAAQLNLERGNKADKITFAMLAKRYQDEIIAQKKSGTAKSNLTQLKALLAFFQTAPLDEIEPPHFVEYMRRRQGTPGAANNEYTLFGHIWKYARQWGYTKAPNPAESVNKFPVCKRTQYIEDDLFKLVYQHADPLMKDLMDLAYLTGQRPVDLAKIEKSHIIDGYLHIHQQKTEAKLRFELVGDLTKIIENRTACSPSAYLFTSRNGSKLTADKIGKMFARLREKVIKLHPTLKAQIQAFQFRDLRAKSGTDKALTQGEEAARQQLGHTSVKMTQTYIRKALAITPLTKKLSE